MEDGVWVGRDGMKMKEVEEKKEGLGGSAGCGTLFRLLGFAMEPD